MEEWNGLKHLASFFIGFLFVIRQAGLGRTGSLIGLYVWLHSWTVLTLGGNGGRHCPRNGVIAAKLQQ